MGNSATYVSRQLTWYDQSGNRQTVSDADVLDRFSGPIAVLGPPGIGKTELLKNLMGEDRNSEPMSAKAFLRLPGPQYNLIKRRIFIDGLDEVAAAEEGDPLHNVLKKLAEFGRPNFVICCRSFEWDSVLQGTEILDDYGTQPVELTIQPFSQQNALELLSADLSTETAGEVLQKLDNLGLEGLHANPLMLRFISDIAKDNREEFPRTKGALYSKAVRKLFGEKNSAHPQYRKLSTISDEEGLNAAGAAMAAMLISGKDALSRTVDCVDTNMLALSELSAFSENNILEIVLGTNLFRPFHQENTSAVPFHRTIAEFLGASWLADRVKRNDNPDRLVNRILGLVTAAGGVPASLRGMHAWLAYFSPMHFAPRVIETDPFAVVRYSDTSQLPEPCARQLLVALKRLSTDDPAFREGHWDRRPVAGLARSELIDDFRDVLTDDETSWALRSLLIESLQNTDIATDLEDDLWRILMNPHNTYHERWECCHVLVHLKPDEIDWPFKLRGVLSLGDGDSARLVLDAMWSLGFDAFDSHLIARSVINATGILAENIDEKGPPAHDTLYLLWKSVTVGKATEILNELAGIIGPFREADKQRWQERARGKARDLIAKLTHDLLFRLIDAESLAATPKAILKWLRALESGGRYRFGRQDKVARYFERRDDIRYAVQRLALAGIKEENEFFRQSYRLRRLSPGLYLRSQDYRKFLIEVTERKDPEERELWQSIVTYLRQDEGLSKEIFDIARPYTEEHPDLLEFLHSMKGKKPLPKWEQKDKRERAAIKREQHRKLMEAHTRYLENLDAVKAGDLHWIYNPALAYLGKLQNLNQDARPQDRITEWLGDELLEPIQEGFEAVLHRSDIPNVKSVAENYACSKRYNIILPMIAGAAQRFFKGSDWSDISDDVLLTIAIGAEQEHIGQNSSQVHGFEAFYRHLGSVIKKRGFTLHEAYSRYRFQPFLGANKEHVPGLYAFVRSDEEYPLSASLSWEWLDEYSGLSVALQRELVKCLINIPVEDRSIYWPRLIEKSKAVLQQASISTKRRELWLSVLFTISFPEAVEYLPEISMSNRDLIWTFTSWVYDRYDGERGRVKLNLGQAKWLVETFRSVWPVIRQPDGFTWGNRNPWDAAACIEWALSRIVRDTSAEATVALNDLEDGNSDDYSPVIKAGIARQNRARLEDSFRAPSIAELRAAVNDEAPETAADILAIMIGELEKLQKRLKGDAFNIVNNFYNDEGLPRTENECRDQLFATLGMNLPFGIQPHPETSMPGGRRSDAAFYYGNIVVPMEAKGQWHRDVWSAASGQLGKLYAINHQAECKGLYVVFWFGTNAPPGKRLRTPPEPLSR